MTDEIREPWESRLIPTASIDIPTRHRRPDAKKVEALIPSIQAQGLLQPIGVTPPDPDGRHSLVFGGHRLAAHKKLGLEAIEAKILDVSPEDAEAAMHAENLFRNDLSLEGKIAATNAWNAHYKAAHPESFGSAALARAGSKKARKPRGDEALSDGDKVKIPPPGQPAEAPAEPAAETPSTPVVADRPSLALSKISGVGETTARRELAVAERLGPDEVKILIEKGVDGITKLYEIARLEPEQRHRAVALIASGMAYDASLAAAKAPANATIEEVKSDQADGHKPEEELTDEEWLAAYCGDVLAHLTYRHAFIADAILWRKTRGARQEFRGKLKKPLAQSKVTIKGPLHYLLSRTTNLAHPKDWPVCGKCGGSGASGSKSQCTTCNGHAFTVKTDKV